MSNVQADQNSPTPTNLVVFGATGDLSTTKLIPALVDLFKAEKISDQFHLVGVSRQSFSDEEFRGFLQQEVSQLQNLSADRQADFLESSHFVSGDVTQPRTYEAVYDRLKSIDKEEGTCLNKLFYLALPPRFYSAVGTQFAESKLMALCQTPSSWWRVLVEKPYGTDLQAAEEIDDALCETFASDQVYRIDHYLAKSALQNVITLRFRNQIFSGGWNRNYIDKIHVKMYESSTVGDRTGFYDQIGAFRDVGQNHVLQLLSATTMEPPSDETPAAVRETRADLLEQLKLPEENNAIVRGQYEGYDNHEGIADQSETETYFRVPAVIDNERWRGVPVTLESGKGLGEDRVEVALSYRESTAHINSIEPVAGNTMVLQFKPNRGVSFDIWTESPELAAGIDHRTVDFSYSPDQPGPDAYPELLNQALHGEQTMFANNREVRASWAFTESVMTALSEQPLQSYAVGSNGP